jgi:hypothetical protein
MFDLVSVLAMGFSIVATMMASQTFPALEKLLNTVGVLIHQQLRGIY